MALSVKEFRVWAVLSVAFIPLSVFSNPVQQLEGHRCYWCGPLAEQVHRSQRAAKCNGDKSKVTICDEDLPYCAIVASSPPYVESRYCVKVYQDECYPLYCNSTRIWKVICPCRGELCNGPNTKRENEVFEALHKLTHQKRLKRALLTNSGFMGFTPRRHTIDNTTIVQRVVPSDDVKNKEIDNAANSIMETHELDKLSTNKIVEEESTDISSKAPQIEDAVNLNTEPSKVESSPKDGSDTTIPEDIEPSAETPDANSGTSAEDAESTEKVTEETPSMDSNNLQTASNSAVIETTSSSVNDEITTKDSNEANDIVNNKKDTIIKIDIPSTSVDSEDLKTEIIIMSTNKPYLENVTKLSTEIENAENVLTVPKNCSEAKAKPTEEVLVSTEKVTEIKEIMPVEKKINKTPAKSNEKLPAAEALQHTENPTTKSIEPIQVISTTVMNINTNTDFTTKPTLLRNNTAVRIDAHILTIAIGIVLQY